MNYCQGYTKKLQIYLDRWAVLEYELPNANYSLVDLVGEYFYTDNIREAIGGLPDPGRAEQTEVRIQLVPEPDNPHGVRGQAISARIHNNVVGYLSNDDAAKWHHEIHRITASNAVAIIRGTVRVYRHYDSPQKSRFKKDRSTLELEINIRINLPEPGHLVPLNTETSDSVSILPWGNALKVTGTEEHLGQLVDYVPISGEGMLILTLHRMRHTLKNGAVRELVEARLDGRRVGQLTPASSLHFLPTIDHADDMGNTLAIWARLQGSSIAVELNVYGARAKELSDDWLSTMPAMPKLVPEALSYDVPDAYTPETTVPTVEKQPPNRVIPTRSASPTSVSRIEYFHDEKNTARYTNSKRTIELNDKHRRHSPTLYKATAWILLLTMSVVALISLGGAPIGLIMTAAALYFGVQGFRHHKLLAEALQFEINMASNF